MTTVDKLSDAAEEAVEKLGEKGEQLMDMEEKFMKKCRTYIRDYPVASIGMALAVGFILSQLSHTCQYRRG